MEKGRGVSQLLVGVNMSHITGVGGVEGWGGRGGGVEGGEGGWTLLTQNRPLYTSQIVNPLHHVHC